MPRTYEIYADESWTHGSVPRNRYWCFLGGIFGTESQLSKLEAALKEVKASCGYKLEVKWANISEKDTPVYHHLLDTFFQHISENDIKYRQLFLDRKYVRILRPGEARQSDLDIQYKIYYQFLKHHFGLEHLPLAQGTFDRVFIRLDTHSSVDHTNSLKEFTEKLPLYLGRTDLHFDVSFVDSKKHLSLQMCDVLMGAAGSYGNKMHLRRENGRRGMTNKQKCRLAICKYIYEKLKAVDKADRGSGAFNWFESTGIGTTPTNKLSHKIRIWKFIPSTFRIDKGWENDHLDSQGRYVAPDFGDTVIGPPD